MRVVFSYEYNIGRTVELKIIHFMHLFKNYVTCSLVPQKQFNYRVRLIIYFINTTGLMYIFENKHQPTLYTFNFS